jgi:hypothetical protein
MPMDPVTTNAAPVNGPSVPVVAPPSDTAPSPVAGASGLPVVAAPAAAPVVTPPATPVAPAPAVESPELVAIRADRVRLEAEIARLTPYAVRGYQASIAPTPPPPATPAPAAAKPSLGVPVLDPGVAAYLTTDASGNVVERPGAPPGTLAQYESHQRAKGQFLAKLTEDPRGALGPLLEEMQASAVEKAKAEVLAEQAKARNAQVAAQIVDANAEWLFEKDAAGQRVVVTDPLTGRSEYKRTEGGEWWATAANQLMQAGITDPVLVDRYAKAIAFQTAYQKANAAAPAVVPPAVPPPAPAAAPDLKTAFLNRIPGAAPGSLTPPGSNPAPATRKLSLQEAMLQGLTTAGYSPGSKLPMAIPQAA